MRVDWAVIVAIVKPPSWRNDAKVGDRLVGSSREAIERATAWDS